MKQPKPLTRQVKEFLSRHNIDWHNYSYISETDDVYVLFNKTTNTTDDIPKRKVK